MLELQLLAKTPNHSLEIGFMENLFEDDTKETLRDNDMEDWFDLSLHKAEKEEKYEEAIKYMTE